MLKYIYIAKIVTEKKGALVKKYTNVQDVIINDAVSSNIHLICKYTVDENIIATTKIRNDYGAIQSFIFHCNIGLFSIASCKVITLNPLCILFGISTLLLF